MNPSLTENPAVTNPRANLKPAQQDALLSIAFYKNQNFRGGLWHIGNKRFSASTIRALKNFNLLRSSGRGLAPTLAGELAAERLRGETR